MLPRRPADRSFLDRRLARIRWIGGTPGPHARPRLAETCRAELEWAAAEWRQTACDDERYHDRLGPHPSEASRLPHEHAAAALLNAHIHVDLENSCLRELRERLRAQRAALRDPSQDAAGRHDWTARVETSLAEWRDHRRRRRMAWRCFLAAARHYAALRAAIDARRPLAA